MSPVDIKNASSLAYLLPGKWLPAAVADLTVSGICLDHRKLESGDLFVALKGSQHDGRRFIAEAIKAGARAVLRQADSEEQTIAWQDNVPVIPEIRLAENVSAIAGRFYGEPSRALDLIGVTGTNGKTTSTHLFAQIQNQLGQKAAVLGTLGYGLVDGSTSYFDNLVETGLTTTDAATTQAILAELRGHGANNVAMEVSSHALDQHRVADLKFRLALFTNLTQDHLDYHGDMVSYGKAKQKLFAFKGLQHRVINIDDEFGRQLAKTFGSRSNTWTYSLQDETASVYASEINLSIDGVAAQLRSPWGEGRLHAALFGEFNLYNLLGVVSACCALGQPLAEVLAAAARVKPVPGRMEPVIVQNAPRVIVDYAHTPDSLQRALAAVRNHADGKLWCVFGCGGDRDRSKRPLMAAAAEQLADEVIVTNDNPRSEASENIFSDIKAGFSGNNYRVIEDRAEAIACAINNAGPTDCVLIAGKGHEDYQLVGANRLPFSDVKQARLALRARMNASLKSATPEADKAKSKKAKPKKSKPSAKKD